MRQRWATERIPIACPPLPGEALDSWIEAYARRLRITAFHFLRFVELPQARVGKMTIRLHAQEARRLSAVAGVQESVLRSLTLEPFDQMAVRLHPDRRAMKAPPSWRSGGASTRFCPRCLHDNGGRWLLAWRLPWTFCCLRHNCQLIGQCPACHKPPRISGSRFGGPSRPGQCANGVHAQAPGGRRDRVPCDFPLPQAAAPGLPARGLIVQAQRAVNQILTQGQRHDRTAAELHLREIYALGRRSLHGLPDHLPTAPPVVHEVLSEWQGSPLEPGRVPNTPSSTAISSTAVGTVLGRIARSRADAQARDLLEWILRVDQARAPSTKDPHTRAKTWKKAGASLRQLALASADSESGLLTRLRDRAPGRDHPARLTKEQLQGRAAKIPGMLWPQWSIRLMPDRISSPPATDGFRRACSAFLLLPGSELDYSGAATLLGHQTPAKDRLAFDRAELVEPALTAVVWALIELTDVLDQHAPPIDYARRRQTFACGDLDLDVAAYTALCRAEGWRTGGAPRLALVRWYLRSLLLGAPALLPERVSYHARDNLRFQIPRSLRGWLLDQAAGALAARGIDEPVQWAPPIHEPPGAGWPGPDPADVDREAFVALLWAGHLVTRVADQLALSCEQTRLYADITDAKPRPAHFPAPKGGRRIPRRGVLSPQSLHHLHLRQRLTPAQIAAPAGCSNTTVLRAMAEAGVERRTYAQATRHRISREWVEHEYLVKLRSLSDLADQARCHPDTMRKMARDWGIVLRAGNPVSNPFAHLDPLPDLSPAMLTTIATPNSIRRLRSLVALSMSTDLSRAATALGIAPNSLRGQIRTLAKATGSPLLASTTPVRLTPSGRRFLDEAVRLLNSLDGGIPGKPTRGNGS
ncbi:TniQ family protein [Actinomadura xylanilytica]|uniref:TniQ family protein n=1 Tax=Actinomadura xylanilytica TaxID=887459 RepID=UPI00255A9BE0|nr:TniQ family protein [Actinomadura xylanilytica]MDL4774874.1 TniQ family protein [Actinomadura xylanilytica]